jgi:hypothetical protein
LRWIDDGLFADFCIPDDRTRALRVGFERVETIRIVDEMPLSTENEETPNTGTLPEHFAYKVEGAMFWNQQSEAFKIVYKNAKHYRFVTGWACLDVISNSEPTFMTVPRDCS